MPSQERCATHLSRPAVDACPVCARPRCGAEAAEHRALGCEACLAARRSVKAPWPTRARVVAGLLTGFLVSVAGGWVSSQYVGATGFDLAAPALTGLATGIAATSAARTHGRGSLDWPLRWACAGLAVLGTALSFRLVVGGGDSPFTPASVVLPPYLAAVGGALASRLLR
ncbi:MAG: hypothetical protein QOJ92_952 [Frankiales bacterium]|nr:hypothetical protein [Frankiales bacterium]